MSLVAQDYNLVPCFVDLRTVFVSTLAVPARVELHKRLCGTHVRRVTGLREWRAEAGARRRVLRGICEIGGSLISPRVNRMTISPFNGSSKARELAPLLARLGYDQLIGYVLSGLNGQSVIL